MSFIRKIRRRIKAERARRAFWQRDAQRRAYWQDALTRGLV